MKRQKPKRDEYEFKKLSGKNSDDSGEETDLFVHKPAFHRPPTSEKNIEEGDTLQALSIRYNCTISELKRLNHIHNDNEIFAKRTIKVPDRPFSAILAGIHSSGRSSPNDSAPKQGIEVHLLDSKLNGTFLNAATCSTNLNDNSFNDIIFNSNIAIKTCDSNSDEEVEITNDEEINLLPKEVVEEPIVVSKLSCSGADADISWISLMIGIVVIILAIPLIYIFYIAEHPEQYHHIHNHHKENLTT